MNNPASNFDDFVDEVTAALAKAAELARDEAIRTNTGIVVSQNGKVVTISAEELKAQKAQEAAAKNK